jgi:hypothetical protein
MNSQLLGGLRFAPNINRGCRVIAHQNNSQTRGPPGLIDQSLYARQALALDLVPNYVPVKNLSHEIRLADVIVRNSPPDGEQ